MQKITIDSKIDKFINYLAEIYFNTNKISSKNGNKISKNVTF
jgi:hypothetical protein